MTYFVLFIIASWFVIFGMLFVDVLGYIYKNRTKSPGVIKSGYVMPKLIYGLFIINSALIVFAYFKGF